MNRYKCYLKLENRNLGSKKSLILTSLFFSTLVLIGIQGCNSDQDEGTDPEITDQLTAVTYTASSEAFPNPERGYLELNIVFSEGEPLETSYIESLRDRNISLVWRLYYLEKFKNSDISSAELDLIQTDMDNLREAGIKCVLRFAYTDGGDDGTDAPIERIESHLDQLKPVFDTNADVIAFVNAGFVGLWGEWAFTTNNLTSTENKKRIVTKLLEVVPPEIKIQLRTPQQKKDVFEISDAMTDEVGYSDADIARVGHHNDCLMSGGNDYGTYTNFTEYMDYTSQEGLYVPIGGETCYPFDGYTLPDCEEAAETMPVLKWTYLNLFWYEPTIDLWKAESCFADFEKSMGYRLRLDSSMMIDTISKTEILELRIDLTNVGWAPLYNKKLMSLVLKSTIDDEVSFDFILQTDIRRAVPGELFSIEESIDISEMDEGSYEVYLKINDQFESICSRPEYAIRLANDEVWNETTGWNSLLREIEITE